MKVCIITMHWVRNCGTYMQAYALGEKIKQLGHEVVYLAPSMDRHIRNAAKFCKHFGKALLKRDFKYALMKTRFHMQALRDTRRLRQVHAVADVNRFVLGSDTIWQMHIPHIHRMLDRYLGLCFPGEKVFAYAASSNDTPLEYIQKDGRLKAALRRMRDVSVRDGNTLNVVRHLTDRPVELVCDPVLLHDPEFYRSIERPCKHKDFILVYGFGTDFPGEERIREIRRFAQEHGKTLISFGLNRKWCDISLRYDFLSMSAYFDHADCVVTNTFHGTVFSILYHKRFVQFALNKPKVKYILEQFNLLNHAITKQDSVESVLTREMDHADVQKRIDVLRSSSIEYLGKNL